MRNKNLEYFIGKPCSIFTTPINRDFTVEGNNYLTSVCNYFLGVVESVDSDGLMLTPITGLKTFIFKQHLVSIAEEQLVEPKEEDPPKIDAGTVKPDLKEVANIMNDLIEDEYIDPDELQKMAKNLKEHFG